MSADVQRTALTSADTANIEHPQTPVNVPHLTGGQVVAGSNPVSPTQVRGCFWPLKFRFVDGLTQTNDPNQLSTAAENRLLCRGQSTHGVRPSYSGDSRISEGAEHRGSGHRNRACSRFPSMAPGRGLGRSQPHRPATE